MMRNENIELERELLYKNLHYAECRKTSSEETNCKISFCDFNDDDRLKLRGEFGDVIESIIKIKNK